MNQMCIHVHKQHKYMYEAKPLAEHAKSRRLYSWYKPRLTPLDCSTFRIPLRSVPSLLCEIESLMKSYFLPFILSPLGS